MEKIVNQAISRDKESKQVAKSLDSLDILNTLLELDQKTPLIYYGIKAISLNTDSIPYNYRRTDPVHEKVRKSLSKYEKEGLVEKATVREDIFGGTSDATGYRIHPIQKREIQELLRGKH